MRHWSGAVIKALSILKSWSKVLRLKPSDMFSLEEASAICQFLTETGPLLVGENSWTLTRFPAGLEPLQGSHACPSRYHGGQSEPAKAAEVAEWGDRGLKHPPDPQFLNAVLKAKANTSRGSGSRTWSLIYRWRKEENLKILKKKTLPLLNGSLHFLYHCCLMYLHTRCTFVPLVLASGYLPCTVTQCDTSCDLAVTTYNATAIPFPHFHDAEKNIKTQSFSKKSWVLRSVIETSCTT